MSPDRDAQPAPTAYAELLRVENLQVRFTLYDGQLRRREIGVVRAVDGVSFSLRRGEALALVGAPCCGKTTVARAVGLLERAAGGRIVFQGHDLTSGRGRHVKRARRQIQLLYSNPYVAFAPRVTVEEILYEALSLNTAQSKRHREERLVDLMAQVGLNLYLSTRFPRDLSGGNRQRLALARALAPDPTLLICDQPTDYVDPAMGDVIIDLLHRLRQQMGLTVLLTTRQLEMARHADRVAIMVWGRIVEMGYYADLIRKPLHPFTKALLERPTHERPTHEFLPAPPPPDLPRPAAGCLYVPLCPVAEARCSVSYPDFIEGAPKQGVACHLAGPG